MLAFGGRIGVRKFSLICIIIVCLAGCSGPDKIEINSAGSAQRLDTYAGIAAYLQGQGLPGLESAEVWKNGYGPGLKLTTTHYEIYTTLLEPFILRGISGFVESAYRAYNSQLPEPIETKTKFIIYLFADRGQWEDFTGGNVLQNKGRCVLS